MRFICNQNVFILIKHLLSEGYGFFLFQLAVIKHASASSKRSLCIYAASGFIHHLTLRHPCLPGRGVHVRILFFEKVDDSFPRTCWKPLATWTNSFDDGKWGVQINLVNLLCSFVNSGAAFMMMAPKSIATVVTSNDASTFRSQIVTLNKSRSIAIISAAVMLSNRTRSVKRIA